MNKKLLRKKLALMLSNLKKKRPYYCEVEYLESNADACILTDYIYQENDVKELPFNISTSLGTKCCANTCNVS